MSTTGWSRSARSRSRSSSSASCGRSSRLRGVDVEVDGPRDATVGDRITLALRDHGPCLAARGAAARSAGRVAAHGRARQAASCVHIAARRGVFRLVRVEVRSGGPLGVFLRRRTLWVRLPVPVVGRTAARSRCRTSRRRSPIGVAAALASRPGVPGRRLGARGATVRARGRGAPGALADQRADR